MSDFPPIIVYSQPNCPPCEWTKAWLQSRGISFEVKDVAEDNEARETLSALGLRSTPVTQCGTDYVIGYNPDELDAFITRVKARGSARRST